MDTKPTRLFDDFQPSFEWKREEGSEILEIYIPGFNKEHIMVQMDNFGNLKISGARPLANEHWSRFLKDFRIPDNTSNADIRAKLENGKLYVKFPKLFTTPYPQDQPAKAQETESGKKTTTEPKPREDQDRTSQKNSTLTSSKSDNGKRRETGDPTDAVKNTQKIQEKKKDQTEKSEDKKDTSETGDKDDELDDISRKRKSTVEDETTDDGGSGVGMKFKKPRQLMLNVGVAAVILVGIAFYVFYKLRKSIEADRD